MEIVRQKANVGVVVGRYQINELHKGHLEMLNWVRDNHTKMIIFLGLSSLKVTRNNPLDFQSRKYMLAEAFPDADILYIEDVVSDDIWSRDLDKQIRRVTTTADTVLLYGSRDSFKAHYTGSYTALELESETKISASEVRKQISERKYKSAEYRAGVISAAMHQYPKVVPTVDVVLYKEDGNKILLARKPNEELLRFIGGFVDPKDKSWEEAAVRELAEEAGSMEHGTPQYIGSALVDDWRYRSEVDKIMTTLYQVNYLWGAAKANDDVAEVTWVDLLGVRLSQIVPEHRPLMKMFLEKHNIEVKE